MSVCLFLLFAGILDAILTNLGIRSGLIEEGNPLMRWVISKNIIAFYLIKISLPLFLVGLFYYRPFKGKIRVLLYATSIIYFSVLVCHVVWITLYLNPSI